MALGDEMAVVIGDDAGRFLAAMLQRMQAQHGQRAGVGMAENAKHAAFLMQRVAIVRDESQIGSSWPVIGLFPPVSTSLSSAWRSLAP